jgi:hypothetical protein
MLTQQPIKTDLTSWQICLGLAPMPQKIWDQAGIKKIEYVECKKKAVRLSQEQRTKVQEFIEPMVMHKIYAMHIHDELINSGLISDDSGNVASFSLVKLIIRDVKTDLGVPKYSEVTNKAVELYASGSKVNQIKDKIGLSRHHVTNILGRKRRKGELC